MPYTFVTGGASSGKSGYALQLFRGRHDVTVIATGVRTDAEMERRIEAHRKERPGTWETIEEPEDLISAMERMNPENRGVIIDCLTVWVSNLQYGKGYTSLDIIDRAKKTVSYIRDKDREVVVVSNELGMGIIPASEELREFRKTAGEVNQLFAADSAAAYFVVSGLIIKLR